MLKESLIEADDHSVRENKSKNKWKTYALLIGISTAGCLLYSLGKGQSSDEHFLKE